MFVSIDGIPSIGFLPLIEYNIPKKELLMNRLLTCENCTLFYHIVGRILLKWCTLDLSVMCFIITNICINTDINLYMHQNIYSLLFLLNIFFISYVYTVTVHLKLLVTFVFIFNFFQEIVYLLDSIHVIHSIFFFLFAILVIQSRASCALGKCSIPTPYLFFFNLCCRRGT
jgi:hypothetical protein